jgi:hypothetical protein
VNQFIAVNNLNLVAINEHANFIIIKPNVTLSYDFKNIVVEAEIDMTKVSNFQDKN